MEFLRVKASQHLHSSPLFQPGLSVARRLQKAGFATYVAGGAVRDALLGRPLKDLDFATAATPEQMRRVFQASELLEIGPVFGVMGVKCGGHVFEVTTFRSEGPYRDGRHPESVAFADVKTDAARRDFTINAMYFDLDSAKILDFYDGLGDLQRGSLRTVGIAEQRLSEDYLRMLRALRFVAVLGFTIEQQTLQAMTALQEHLLRVSKERLTAEFQKLLLGRHMVLALARAHDVGFFKVFAGVESEAASYRRTCHLLTLTQEDGTLAMRLAALIYFYSQQGGDLFLRHFRFAKGVHNSMAQILESARTMGTPSVRLGAKLKTLGRDTGLQGLQLALNVRHCMNAGDADLRAVMGEFQKVCGKEARLPEPWVGSQDLLSRGWKTGPRFGKVLEEAYLLQLEQTWSRREQALEWLQRQDQ